MMIQLHLFLQDLHQVVEQDIMPTERGEVLRE